MRLKQSHDAEGNTQGTHSIPHTDKLNFATAVGFLPKCDGILTGTGMVFARGALVDFPCISNVSGIFLLQNATVVY